MTDETTAISKNDLYIDINDQTFIDLDSNINKSNLKN